MPLHIPDQVAPHFKTQVVGDYLLSYWLWNRDRSRWKLLFSTSEKMGHIFQPCRGFPPHLYYSHVPSQHLGANPVDLSIYAEHHPTNHTTQLPYVSFNRSSSHHLGNGGVHGEDFKYPLGTKYYNAIIDMVLCCVVSGRV